MKAVIVKFFSIKSAQSILVVILLETFITWLLKIHWIEKSSFTFLITLSIFVGCIVYFREQIKRIVFNFKNGTFELELMQFKEDIVNALVVKQKLLEISSGRWEGPPKKLREILEKLDEDVSQKANTYSPAAPLAGRIVYIYKQIDTVGTLKRADPDHDEKLKNIESYQEELDKAFDDFLIYLKNRNG